MNAKSIFPISISFIFRQLNKIVTDQPVIMDFVAFGKRATCLNVNMPRKSLKIRSGIGKQCFDAQICAREFLEP